MPAVIYGPTTLSDLQVGFSNGTIAGAGTNIILQKITGLRATPALRSGNVPQGQADGVYPGFNLLGPRVLQFMWEIMLPFSSGTTTEAVLSQLNAAWQNIPDPSSVVLRAGNYLRQQAGIGPTLPLSVIQVKIPGRTYSTLCFGRPTKAATDFDLAYQYGDPHPATEWTSEEGVLYDSNVLTAATGLPNPTSGLTFPATANFVFGSSTGGSVTINNTGNYPTWPYWVIKGPCSNPMLISGSTGQTLRLNTVLGATDTVGIDAQSGTVTLNGTANRNTLLDPNAVFFQLPPGQSTVQFTSTDSTAVAGTLTGYALPAYSII